MPALLMVTTCCSIASWMATRSAWFILSNSSIQITPRSASTIAPASRWKSLEFGSLIIAAVRPTPLEPFPVVLMAKGAVFITKRSIWDLPQLGSPTISTLMSPLRWVPLLRFFSTPDSSCNSKPCFTFSWPQIAGANDRDNNAKVSWRAPIFLMFSISSATNWPSTMSLTDVMLVATSLIGNTPSVKSCMGGGKPFKTPMTCTRSPGLALSQRSPSQRTWIDLGISPGGAASGDS
mmetsp:Transcript_48957/g.116437  ORF Transcript_48957/g.116437 Transcript_48957/m.116437 type:complete len:235 (+) Transcript_48957:1111-1815(+)